MVVHGDAREIGELPIACQQDGFPNAPFVALSITDQCEDPALALLQTESQSHAHSHGEAMSK